MTVDFSDANHATFTYTTTPDLVTETVSSEESCHMRELLDLYGAVVEDRSTRTPIREGALSLDLALAARHSAETCSVITLA